MSRDPDAPRIELFDRHGGIDVDWERLRAFASDVVPACMQQQNGKAAALGRIEAIEVSVVDDAAIARIHGEFLNDPSPTDVITFDHGEILISADTAARQAAEFGQDLGRELALYIVHGLLHLAGHEDGTDSQFEAMRELQERLLTNAW